jgi:hypothetical protein
MANNPCFFKTLLPLLKLSLLSSKKLDAMLS